MTDCGFIVAYEWPAFVAQQQTWIAVIEICAGVLLILALLNLLVGWLRHLSWRSRSTALVPFGAGIGAGIVAHSLQDIFLYWVNFLCNLPRSFPQAFQNHFLQGIADASHSAAVFGWASVLVTGVLLVWSFVGMWRLEEKAARQRLT